MDDDRRGQSGYYQEIARAFLERRGGPFFLSPKDQAMIAAWEDKRSPSASSSRASARTFERLQAAGPGNEGRSPWPSASAQVEAAFAQHRDRGRRPAEGPGAAPRSDKEDKARREIEQGPRGACPPATGS